MGLATYRTCSRHEKRDLLALFWQRRPTTSDRVRLGAVEYAPWAVACTAVVAVEVALMLGFLLARHEGVAWLVGLVEAGVLAATSWAAFRWSSLRHEHAHLAAAPPSVGAGPTAPEGPPPSGRPASRWPSAG